MSVAVYITLRNTDCSPRSEAAKHEMDYHAADETGPTLPCYGLELGWSVLLDRRQVLLVVVVLRNRLGIFVFMFVAR
jgi:hypothetical protein